MRAAKIVSKMIFKGNDKKQKTNYGDGDIGVAYYYFKLLVCENESSKK